MPLTRARARAKSSTPSSVDENEFTSSQAGTLAEPMIDPQNHPLMNDVVLTVLFEYLSVDELLTCRLVNKQWNQLTLPFCRSKFLVTIMTPQRHFKSPERGGLVSFIKLMKSNTLGNPYAHYRLWPFNNVGKRTMGQQFLELCAGTAKGYILDGHDLHKIEDVSELLKSSPQLESLKLPEDMTSKHNTLDTLEPKIVKLFPGPENEKPKLTFLKSLSCRHEIGYDRSVICPTFYEELFSVAENISTLDLWTVEWGGEEKVAGQEVLEAIEKHGRESTIKSMKLPPFNDTIMEILRRMALKPNGLKLEHLDFGIQGWQVHNLNEILRLSRDSLVSLRITMCYRSSGQDIWLPSMPKLKRFQMWTKDSILIHGNFNETFPVLEELKFSSYGCTNRFLDLIACDSDEDNSSGVKSLNLGGNSLEMETLNRCLTLFPILTKLECEIGGQEVNGMKILKKIWTHMTQLEELTITGHLRRCVDLDTLLTGIHAKELKGIKETNVFDSLGLLDLEERRSKLLMLTNQHRQLPSIGNLKNLRLLKLGLSSTAPRSSKEKVRVLTDMTGYLGLYSLKNLRHLFISLCGLSKPCAEMLVKDNCLLSWRFNSQNGRTHIIPPRLNHDRKCLLDLGDFEYDSI